MKIRVFDPPLCCSTGDCEVAIDPQLVNFSADLDWLKSQGVSVECFNLSQHPFAFAGDADVIWDLQVKGGRVLSIVKIDDQIKIRGSYPTRDQLAAWTGAEIP